jgi:hypothetical protein
MAMAAPLGTAWHGSYYAARWRPRDIVGGIVWKRCMIVAAPSGWRRRRVVVSLGGGAVAWRRCMEAEPLGGGFFWFL